MNIYIYILWFILWKYSPSLKKKMEMESCSPSQCFKKNRTGFQHWKLNVSHAQPDGRIMLSVILDFAAGCYDFVHKFSLLQAIFVRNSSLFQDLSQFLVAFL